MGDLGDVVDRVAAETRFSGAVRVDGDGDTLFARAWGLADRRHGIPNRIDTQFGIASGQKGLTAVTVASLIEDGTLDWSTPARSILGSDLPLIDDRVTIEHLLAHRSGIGDYIDESEDRPKTDYVMTVPVHELSTTESYLPALDGTPQVFEPGSTFRYCDSGYVVLALIAERAGGAPFPELVRQRVTEPAGMPDTAFLRSDELPARAAIGYLGPQDDRTNVLHLPVVGSGDGGISSTLADIHAFWEALFAGRLVSPDTVSMMVSPHSDVAEAEARYGLGFWLAQAGPAVELEGADAGVSFRSVHDPVAALTYTVVSNTTDGAWPVLDAIAASLRGD